MSFETWLADSALYEQKRRKIEAGERRERITFSFFFYSLYYRSTREPSKSIRKERVRETDTRRERRRIEVDQPFIYMNVSARLYAPWRRALNKS